MTRTLNVALGANSYAVHIGAGLIANAGALLAPACEGSRAVIVTNAAVGAHWLAPLRASLRDAGIRHESVLIPDGEQHKTWATAYDLVTRLLEIRMDRASTLIALGGGVVGDVAGFAASIYQRGIRCVQVPTTLLAQVDSSVGGKTGVNHPLGKNMIGAFHQPSAVLIDTDCLSTLPRREFVAGLAEVIKYGAIRDAGFFSWLEADMARLLARDPEALAEAILQSCRTKADVVAMDERESGVRAILNFGHTFGHAIEAGLGFGEWLHGEAVGAGMVVAATVSSILGRLPPGESLRLRRLVGAAGLPVEVPALGFDRWMELMGRDKKVAEGAIRYILLDAIGAAVVTSEVSEAALRDVLR